MKVMLGAINATTKVKLELRSTTKVTGGIGGTFSVYEAEDPQKKPLASFSIQCSEHDVRDAFRELWLLAARLTLDLHNQAKEESLRIG